MNSISNLVVYNHFQRSVSDSFIENKGLFDIMKDEGNRLNSFNGKWPLDFIAMNDLAQSGFFYLLSDDKVQCAFCKLILAQWAVGDEPLDQHHKFSSKCCFLSSLKKTADPNIKTSNISFFHTPLFNSSKPQRAKIPRMSDVKKRLSTFKGWSVTMISAEDLAACGLFYTGVDDVVTCFSCGISLGDWEPNDEPMTKHSRLFPNCIFLHFVISCSVLEGRKTRKPVNTFPEIISRKTLRPSLPDVLKTEICLKAKEIFPPQLVEEVVRKRLTETGDSFSSLQHLCDKVLEYEEKKLKIRLSTTPKESEQPHVFEDPIKTGYSTVKNSREVFLCKICLTNEMSITFQPCGHLMSCDSCSYEVSKCPICRLPIQNRIKTYLS